MNKLFIILTMILILTGCHNQTIVVKNNSMSNNVSTNEQPENQLMELTKKLEEEIDKLEEKHMKMDYSELQLKINIIQNIIDQYDTKIQNSSGIDMGFYNKRVSNFNDRIRKIINKHNQETINKEGIKSPKITKIIDSLGNEYIFQENGLNGNPIRPTVKTGDLISFSVYSNDSDSDIIYYKYYTNGKNHYGWTENYNWTWNVSLDDLKDTTAVFFFIKDDNDIFYQPDSNSDQEIHLYYNVITE